MNQKSHSLTIGQKVKHSQHGSGTVIATAETTAVVRFDLGIHECLLDELEQLSSIYEDLTRHSLDSPLEVINRIQAEAIVSINEAWGVFSRSKIELLPHQLWVCRQVNREWPTNWLVADDVGLGKTIEAGLILTPLISSGKVKRLIVLCPASLVEQWQYRLRTMFDIRLTPYFSELDTPRAEFWEIHDQVVASIQTLRMGVKQHSPEKAKKRRTRLLDSKPWDMIIVDEAHHLSAHEKEGATLSYQLLQDLKQQSPKASLLLFTGTPHRGKNYGFLALLELLRPDLFDTDHELEGQLKELPNVMIRNNKSNVTDMHGNRLFKNHVVSSETYTYSQLERIFYDMLSNFIVQGRAYAANLPVPDQRTATFVLIAMQKLASSSVAAIRRAITNRINGIKNRQNKIEELRLRMSLYREMESIGLYDEISLMEENLLDLTSTLSLMTNEEAALKQLLDVASQIKEETKIKKIVDMISVLFKDRSILIFTEYKATQSLIISSLTKKYGSESVVFINGDEKAEGIILPDDRETSISMSRHQASQAFNSGKSRFLVSTEAGGEGIDLQENCHTLIHADLPWNPMRLHQRIGRLNRYGQREVVEVLTLRNEDTVESMIWDKLNEKLNRINLALAAVMEEPEDMLQLVLGMTSPNFFNNLFAEGETVPKDKLSEWFDHETSLLGGHDVLDEVRKLVGNVSKFDFKDFSQSLPQVTLLDLKPFFESALTLNSKKLVANEFGLSFKTPDEWKLNQPAVRPRHDEMTFDRNDEKNRSNEKLLGVGHKVLDMAIEQAKSYRSSVTILPKQTLSTAVIAFRIRDRVTSHSIRPPVVAAIKINPETSETSVLLDWQLLQFLNGLPLRKDFMRIPPNQTHEVKLSLSLIETARIKLKSCIEAMKLGFLVPQVEFLAALFPQF